jgi:energy-coupling factor transport system substrate-specific component
MLIVSSTQGKKKGLTIRETALFAMLGTLMFCSKILMEFLPNIHLLGMFTMVYTLAFRKKALIPIYVSVLLTGLYFGFNMWWLPYIYIWTILWAVTMALPRNMSKKARYIVYPIVCCLHGLLYGTLYAPAQALMMGLGFKAMLAWIVSGLPWDLVHGAGNLVAGLLLVPLAELLGKLQKANISI